MDLPKRLFGAEIRPGGQVGEVAVDGRFVIGGGGGDRRVDDDEVVVEVDGGFAPGLDAVVIMDHEAAEPGVFEDD